MSSGQLNPLEGEWSGEAGYIQFSTPEMLPHGFWGQPWLVNEADSLGNRMGIVNTPKILLKKSYSLIISCHHGTICTEYGQYVTIFFIPASVQINTINVYFQIHFSYFVMPA